MKQTDNSKAALFQNRSHRRRNWRRVFFGMAMVVVFVTTYMLILPAITMEHSLACGLEEHTHTDDCYTAQLVCALESASGEEPSADPAHVHADGCYALQERVVCGQWEQPHSHGDDCYTARAALACADPAHAAHSHGEDCYEEQDVLLCDREETEGHSHGDDCYGQVQDLICEQEELPAHSHEGDCYGTQQTLTCDLPEGQDGHTDDCYDQELELTCTLSESAEPHTHDDSCKAQENVLVCTLTEGEVEAEPQAEPAQEAHFHTAPCYQQELTCPLPEHTHDESCERDPDAEETMMILPEGAEVPAGYETEYAAADDQGRFRVAVYAPADALPQGAVLLADLLAEDSQAYISAAQALTADYTGLLALDIRFELDGAEVEPAQPVYVCINALGLLPEDADPTSVTVEHHVETQEVALFTALEEQPAVEVVAGPDSGGVETAGNGDLAAAFEVERLSTFTIRWTSAGAAQLPVAGEGADTMAQGLVFHLFDYDPEAMSSVLETGMIQDTLGEDGYPVLDGESQQSLASLFDPGSQTEGKTVYPNANYLLQDTDGYYEFDSDQTFAQVSAIPEEYELASGETIQSYPFTLYQQAAGSAGAFLPFDQPGQEGENLALGMTMAGTVAMPEDGMTGGEPMVLELAGSDDLWLFLDGKLVLDLSGSAAGILNFAAEASVTRPVTLASGVTEDVAVGPGQVWTEETGVQDLWTLLGLEEAWETGSSHQLTLFYLNRGESSPSFQIRFNLPTAAQEAPVILSDFTAELPLSLTLEGARQVIGFNQAWTFRFLMEQVDGPEGSEPGESGMSAAAILAVGSEGRQTGVLSMIYPGDTPDGTYYYKVYQDDTDLREGVTYDGSYYIATVEVTEGAAAVTQLQHYVDGQAQVAETVTFANVAAAEGTLVVNNVVVRTDGNPQRPNAVNEYVLTFSTSVLDQDYRTYYAPYTRENHTEGGLVHSTGDGRLAFTVDRTKGVATATLDLYAGETAAITLPAGAEVKLENLWTVAFDIKWTGDTATGNEVAGAVVTAAPISGQVELTCTNTTGFQLPETGGPGATPLLVMGTLLTIGAGGIFLFLRRRGDIFSA